MTHPVMPRLAKEVQTWRALVALAAIVTIVSCVAIDAVSAQAPEPDPVLRDAIELRQLAEEDYSARQQATLEMWRRRDLSRDEVQAASRDSDPEVASRAQWILRQWRRGALPDTPPDVSRLLQRTDDPSAIEELLDAGQFGAAAVAVEESAGTPDRDAVRMRVVMSLQRRFPIYVVLASRSGKLPDLLQLVDLVANTKEFAVTRVELMHKLGLGFDEASLLPQASETWSETERVQAKVLVHASTGNPQEAIDAARGSGDETLLRVTRMLDQRWQEIAEAGATAARASATGSLEQTRHWCYTLIGADRAGLDELRSEAVEALTSEQAARSEIAIDLRWKCLASHGEIDTALGLLGASDPAAAALVAMAASRPEQAFEWLGTTVERTETEWMTLVDEAIAVQQRSTTPEAVAELERVLALTRCLISVGRSDLAWITAERLAHADVPVGNATVRDAILTSLSLTRRDDWVVQLSVFRHEDALGLDRQRSVVRILDEADHVTLKILVEAFASLFPSVPFDERFRAVCQFISGEVPPFWDRSVDYRRLYDQLTRGKRQIQRIGGQVVVAANPQLNLNLVKLFARHGEAGLADEALQQMVGFGDVEAAFQLAENQRLGGRRSTAESLYQSVWDAIATQRSRLPSVASGAESHWAVKSLIAKWTLAKRAGDPETAAQLLDEIELALCSPSTELRHEAAQYLTEIGEHDFAIKIYETLLPMTAFGTRDGTEFYDVANRFAALVREEDAGRAAAWFDLAVGGTLESVYFREIAYVTLPLYVSRWRLEAAVERGDAEAVHRHLERITAINALDIDTAERLFPKMRDADLTDAADAALASLLQRGADYLRRFPLDATMHNNLAWVAAMNDTALDSAREWSQRAVDLEPDSAVYRDTLAEVLFRLGDAEQALQIERACLLDEPGEWHLHEQVQRFGASATAD